MTNLPVSKRVAWVCLLVMVAAGTAIMIDELTTDKALFQEHLVMVFALSVPIIGGILWFIQWYRKHLPPNE